jgi:parallel beta-helix repeat protein
MRWNNGYGIRLNGHSGNTIENNLAHDNGSGGLHMTNYNNNVMGNEWR